MANNSNNKVNQPKSSVNKNQRIGNEVTLNQDQEIASDFPYKPSDKALNKKPAKNPQS